MPKPLVQSTGRRKAAIARVRLRPGDGKIVVNGRAVDEYFPSATHRMVLTEPLRVVDDQIGSPTYAGHLAIAVVEALDAGLGPGIYHMAGNGYCSWFELAQEVVRCAGLRVPIEPITTAQLNRPAPRPAYSALASERHAPQLPPWFEGVAEAVAMLTNQEEG